MTRPNRPNRHNKQDRLMHRGASAEEIACDFALAPFDTVARDLERKWGINRLEGLVSPVLAAKYGFALGHLNACIDAANPTDTAAAAANCVKGMKAMDAEATTAGHQPIPPEAQEIDVDGHICAVLWDGNAWPVYAALRPGIRTYTPREVGVALAAYGQTVASVKDSFPGAEVKAVRSPLAQILDDEIPFAPETRA
jgi:hypothetical protein